jgi:hypothetical protein
MGSNRLPACAPDNLNQNNNLRSRIETNTSMASRLHATVCQFPPVGKIFRSVDALEEHKSTLSAGRVALGCNRIQLDAEEAGPTSPVFFCHHRTIKLRLKLQSRDSP